MNSTYLEKHDPKRNLYRFYSLEVSPTLFGEWSLIRRWGRIGSTGAKLEQWFASIEDAQEKLQTMRKAKIKRGYSALLLAQGA